MIYWAVFVFFAWMALSHARPILAGNKTPLSSQWLITFILLSLFIGFRHKVGADWVAYIVSMEGAENKTLTEYLNFIHFADPAYAILNWFSVNIGGGIYFVNFICAMFFTWGLLVFCRDQPRPWLALLVSVPYLVIVVAMGYTRQGAAIGLSMLGMVALGRGEILRFMFWVALASTFHKSAVILLPFAVMMSGKVKWSTITIIGTITVILFLLHLQGYVDELVKTYFDTEYSSSGATVRIAMNSLPALLFLWRRKNFNLSHYQLKFWSGMSYMALSFIALLAISPSTTAVDRIALYWIPLQLFVLSRLPDAINITGFRNIAWVYVVIMYGALVLYVWLFFSDHASEWSPYYFYPWVWICQ